MHDPAHPGEVLKEWLEGITVTDAAEKLGVTRLSLSKILNEHSGISPEMDLRLSKALGTTPGFWYAMQGQWDMAQAKRKFRARVQQIISPESVDAQRQAGVSEILCVTA
jgi:addiction module HigA family antidote